VLKLRTAVNILMRLIIHGMRLNASLKSAANTTSRRATNVHEQNAQNQQNALIAA